MLQGIRDRAQSWIMWIIVILITIPFALWGVHQYFGPEAEAPVASVNGHDLSVREFHTTYQQQRQRLQSVLGSSFDVSKLDEAALKRQTLDRMITDEVVLQDAMDNGLTVGDAQLAQIIRSMDVFKVGGKFSQERYDGWLRSQGYLPAGFEHIFRRSLIRAQVNVAVVGSAIVTSHDVDTAIQLQNQTRTFSYALIPTSRYLSDAKVDDAAAKSYYEAHLSDFVSPEQIKVQYVELSKESIASKIQVSDADVKARYETEKANFLTSEQRRPSHILLTLAEDAPAAKVQEVMAKAQDIEKQLKAGASFAELAKKYSQDPGSAQAGGDVGWIQRGMMVGPFEDAVFSMSKGQISKPVRSAFGVHIIKLDDIRPAKTAPFDQVKERVRREIQLDRAEQRYFDQAERLANLAFEHPDSLETAAQTLGLEIKESGFFGRKGGEGILADPKVVTAAFSDEVLGQGLNSEPVELPQNRVVVLREIDHKPSSQQPLEEVKGHIVDILKHEQAKAKAAEAGAAALARLRGGATLADVAAADKLEWSKQQDVERTDTHAPAEVLNAAFQISRPEHGKLDYGSVRLPSGDYALIALEGVTDGVPGTADSGVRQALKKQLAKGYGEEAYSAFERFLRNAAEVKILQKNL